MSMKRMNVWKYRLLDGICDSATSTIHTLDEVIQNTRSSLSAYCSTLTSAERDATMYEYDFFCSFITIGQIIRAFEKLSIHNNVLFFKQEILLHSDKILPINNVLARYYKSYVTNNLYTHIKFFDHIINVALNSDKKNIFVDYYRTMLGDRLYKIANKQLVTRPCNICSSVTVPFDKMHSTISSILFSLNDPTRIRIWGEKYVNTSSELIDKIEPYTAYYNIPVLGTITYAGSTQEKLKHSVLYNAYPGLDNMYAHLSVCDQLDNNAYMLFTGFATFATIHYDKDSYTKELKNLYYAISKIMLNKNYVDALDSVYMYASSSMPTSVSIIMLELISAFPTLIPAQALGSIAIETLIHMGFSLNPADFLEVLKRKNVGNYFAIWDKDLHSRK